MSYSYNLHRPVNCNIRCFVHATKVEKYIYIKYLIATLTSCQIRRVKISKNTTYLAANGFRIINWCTHSHTTHVQYGQATVTNDIGRHTPAA